MISLLLLLFSISQSLKVPKFSSIYVGPNFSEESVQKDLEEEIKREEEKCKSDERDEDESYEDCMAYINSLEGYFYSKGSDINSVLKKVSKATEYLIIVGFNFGEIDFNNLKAQMVVHFEYDDTYDEESYRNKKHLHQMIKRMKKVKFDGSEKSLIEFGRTKKPSDFYDEVVSIVGDMKKKVSYLDLNDGHFKFIKSDANCHTIYCEYAKINPESKKIRSDSFIFGTTLYRTSGEYLFTDDLVQVNQIGYFPSSSNINELPISYHKNNWIIYDESSYYNDEIIIPYKSATTINTLSYATHYIIELDSESEIDSFKPINISIGPSTGFFAKTLEKMAITIEQRNFDKVDIEKRPKITLVYDKDSYSFDQNANPGFKVDEQPIYNYEPQNRSNGTTNVGMIVGIVVAVVVVIVIVIVVVIIVLRKKKKAGDNSASEA